jgi:hypothetical protein
MLPEQYILLDCIYVRLNDVSGPVETICQSLVDFPLFIIPAVDHGHRQAGCGQHQTNTPKGVAGSSTKASNITSRLVQVGEALRLESNGAWWTPTPFSSMLASMLRPGAVG